METARAAVKPIPDRVFFRIGDVAELLGVKAYVLRYWESEFSIVSPSKSQAGHRVYRRQDVENLQLIQHLLYEERYSIEGARKRLKELRKSGALKGAREELQKASDDRSHGDGAVAAGPAIPVEALRGRGLGRQDARLHQLAHELRALAQVSVDELFGP